MASAAQAAWQKAKSQRRSANQKQRKQAEAAGAASASASVTGAAASAANGAARPQTESEASLGGGLVGGGEGEKALGPGEGGAGSCGSRGPESVARGLPYNTYFINCLSLFRVSAGFAGFSRNPLGKNPVWLSVKISTKHIHRHPF